MSARVVERHFDVLSRFPRTKPPLLLCFSSQGGYGWYVYFSSFALGRGRVFTSYGGEEIEMGGGGGEGRRLGYRLEMLSCLFAWNLFWFPAVLGRTSLLRSREAYG